MKCQKVWKEGRGWECGLLLCIALIFTYKLYCLQDPKSDLTQMINVSMITNTIFRYIFKQKVLKASQIIACCKGLLCCYYRIFDWSKDRIFTWGLICLAY